MAGWTVYCPDCGATNRVPADDLTIECGKVSCTHVCENCGNAFTSEQPYWRWLGLKEAPPAGDENGEADDPAATETPS